MVPIRYSKKKTEFIFFPTDIYLSRSSLGFFSARAIFDSAAYSITRCPLLRLEVSFDDCHDALLFVNEQYFSRVCYFNENTQSNSYT